MINFLKKIFIKTKEINLENLTKLELEAIGRDYGIEIDRRRKKETIIKQIEEARDA